MAKNLNLKIDLKKLDIKQLAGSLKNVNLTSLKKYASLFPSVGLLLVAVMIFILTLLMGGSVSKKTQQSVKASRDIQSKISQTPSEADVAEAERYYEKYSEDAVRVNAMAIRTSQRELVCYNPVIFPEPVDKSIQIYDRFGSQYRGAIEKLMERISAKDAPSEAEIRSRTGMGNPAGGEGGFFSPRAGGTTGPHNARVDAFCLQRADEIPVYANPESFSWYGFWDKYTYRSKDQALTDCWNSQVAYWIYEDVIRTIEVFNTGSSKVSTSPVKRLLGVSFNGPVQTMSSAMAGGFEGMGGMPGMGGVRASGYQVQDIPTYVKGYSVFMPVPWTGRMSNEEIDVIHFAVSVVVDSKSIAAFMKELCSAKPHTYREKFEQNGKEETAFHNQITILQYQHQPIVRDNPAHAYYRYGKDAAVQVDLVCEYIFNRKGYDVIQPAPIKTLLGIQAAGQNPAGG